MCNNLIVQLLSLLVLGVNRIEKLVLHSSANSPGTLVKKLPRPFLFRPACSRPPTADTA